MFKTCFCFIAAIVIVTTVAVDYDDFSEIERNDAIGRAGKANCDSLTWKRVGSMLVINGTGDMCNYSSSSDVPWSSDSIASIEMEEGITSIGEYAFSYLSRLTSVRIPSTVTSIADYAFFFSNKLQSVTIPSNVKIIGNSAFHLCQRLSTVTFSDGLKQIGSDAFNECALINVTIPSTVRYIGKSAFVSCSKMTHITIPSSVTTIGDRAFSSCTSLSSVDMKARITNLGMETFVSCSNLASIVLPPSITSIGKSAFASCSSLSNVTILSESVSIGDSSFEKCVSLKSIVLPEKTTSIGSKAFGSCGNLSSVFYLGSNPLSTDDAFASCGALNHVCVPPDYGSDTFCGKMPSSTQTCSIFQKKFNHCFKAMYVDGDFVQQKRKNATDFEASSTVCTKCECDNETGKVYTPKCIDKDCMVAKCNDTTGECEYDRIEGWDELIVQENKCYELGCLENKWVLRERNNASEWEKRSNGCVEYHCHNESGFIWWNNCNNTKTATLICMNDQCVEDNTTNDNDDVWSVVIELDGVKVIEINTSEVIDNIAALTGIDKEDISIAFETDNDGNVVTVILFLKEGDFATRISKEVTNMDKGEGCAYGVLCKTTRVAIRGSHQLSAGYHCFFDKLLMSATMLLFVIIML